MSSKTAFRGTVSRVSYRALRRLGYDVVRLSPGSVLVNRRGYAAKHWMEQDKAVFNHLASTQIVALLRMYKANCVLDVGANKGQYARMLRRAGYKGHIVSFEPVPEVFERLAAAAAKDKRWTASPYALGREDGQTTINAVPGTLSSLLPPTKFGAGRYPKLQAPREVQIEVRRLDSILDEVLPALDAPPRLYLKLDTQGFDLEAFAGLGERVRDVVALQSEVSLMQIYEGMPPMSESLAVYEAAGFGVSGMYPVSRQSKTGRVLEYDCIMVRPEALPGWQKDEALEQQRA